MESKHLFKAFLDATEEKEICWTEYDEATVAQKKALKALRKHLDRKEHMILKMRRIDGMTLEAVGREFGLTRQRILDLEKEILEKIKFESQ